MLPCPAKGGDTAETGSTLYYVTAGGGCVTSAINCTGVFLDVQDSVPTPQITVTGGVLVSSIANGNQWFTGGAAISGATNDTFTAVTSGWYYTAVSNGLCDNVSDSVYVTGAGTDKLEMDAYVRIYPVPVTNVINVSVHAPNAGAWQLSLADYTGRVLYAGNVDGANSQVAVASYPAGVYLLTISSVSGRHTYKIVKQ